MKEKLAADINVVIKYIFIWLGAQADCFFPPFVSPFYFPPESCCCSLQPCIAVLLCQRRETWGGAGGGGGGDVTRHKVTKACLTSMFSWSGMQIASSA